MDSGNIFRRLSKAGTRVKPHNFDFCSSFSLEERLEISQALLKGFENHISVVCERSKNIKSSKNVVAKLEGYDTVFLVPKDMTIGQLKYMVRRRVKKLVLRRPIILKLKGEIYLTTDQKISELLEHISNDNFIYFTYEEYYITEAETKRNLVEGESAVVRVSDVLDSVFSVRYSNSVQIKGRSNGNSISELQSSFWFGALNLKTGRPKNHDSNSQHKRHPDNWFTQFYPKCVRWSKLTGINIEFRDNDTEVDECEDDEKIESWSSYKRERVPSIHLKESKEEAQDTISNERCSLSSKCGCTLRSNMGYTFSGDVQRVLEGGVGSLNDIEVIDRDVPRTYPAIEYFQSEKLQMSIRRVLQAIAVTFPELGYVQSMNLLAAQFLMHSNNNEDFAYAIMCQLITHPNYNMWKLYEPGLPSLIKYNRVVFQTLFQQDKDLHKHLCQIGLGSLYFLHSWLISLFSYSMPFDHLSEVWDFFFEHGWEALFRVCIVLIIEKRDDLLNSNFDEASTILRLAPIQPSQDLVEKAKTLKLSQSQLHFIFEAQNDSISASATTPPTPTSSVSSNRKCSARRVSVYKRFVTASSITRQTDRRTSVFSKSKYNYRRVSTSRHKENINT